MQLSQAQGKSSWMKNTFILVKFFYILSGCQRSQNVSKMLEGNSKKRWFKQKQKNSLSQKETNHLLEQTVKKSSKQNFNPFNPTPRIISVCLTIFWGWRIKGYMKASLGSYIKSIVCGGIKSIKSGSQHRRRSKKIYWKEKLLAYGILENTLCISCAINLETINSGRKQSCGKLLLTTPS